MSSSPVADPKRLGLVGVVLGGGLLLTGFGQFRVHVVDRGHTLALAKERNRLTTVRILSPRRGRIVASDGQPLAQDLRSGQLTIDFGRIPHSRAFMCDLAAATGVPAAEFEALAESGTKRKTWLRPLGPAAQDAIEKVRDSWRADGVSVRLDGKRSYPFGEATACLVGLQRELLGKDKKAHKVVMGLEAAFDDELAGTSGRREGMTDRNGAFLVSRLVGEQKPKIDGKDVVLTIDTTVQNVAYEAVKAAVTKFHAKDGAAIVINPATGDIIALANYPSFHPEVPDPTDLNPGGYNPAVRSVLEPGSTFKILTLARALDGGKANMSEIIRCGGELSIGKRARIRCDSHGGNRAHGPVDPVKAIAKSCNVSAATWARRIGHDDFFAYIDALGLMDKPGFGLQGERRGLLERNADAKPLQLATLGFGQSINCTPVALASAFSMLANGGMRMRPRLVKSVGGVDRPIEQVGGRIVSEATASEVMRCMEAVFAQGGTGDKLTIPGYRLGGKTGTAQKLDKGGNHVSSFVGVVPAPNAKALVLVMVDSPKGTKYGGVVAGPAFKEIATALIRRYRIAPSVVVPAKRNEVARQ